jgi:hypothetical protein
MFSASSKLVGSEAFVVAYIIPSSCALKATPSSDHQRVTYVNHINSGCCASLVAGGRMTKRNYLHLVLQSCSRVILHAHEAPRKLILASA